MRLDGLDLNLVIALEAILRLRSVSAAAAETHLTQPALSRSLGRLRAHFGDPLVLQSGRELVPTEFGAALHLHATRLLHEARAFTQMRALFDPLHEQREFSVICSDYVTLVLMARVMERLAVLAPRVTLRCISIDTSADALFARGDIDFRVVPEVVMNGQHPHRELFEDTFVSVVWEANPEVGAVLDLETFLRLRHAATAFGSQRYGSHLEQFLAASGITLDVAMLVPNFSLLPHLVIGTPYIATIHARLASLLPGDMPVRFLPPPLPVPVLRQHLEWHATREADMASVWMRNVLVETARALPSPRRMHNSHERHDPYSFDS